MLYDILFMFRSQEVIPFILLAFFSVGLIIIFEKTIALQFIYRINFKKYNTQIKKMLLANDLDRARSFSRATSLTGVPMIATKALEAYEYDPFRVRAAVTEEALLFFPNIRRRLTQLPNLAASCLIVGSLSAVNGIWKSFQMVEGLELGIKSFAFSVGLTQSLLPLAVALTVAVFLMLFFGILDAMAWRLEGEMEHSLAVITNILAPEREVFFAPTSTAEKPMSEAHSENDNDEDYPKPEMTANESKNTTKAENNKNGAAIQSIPDEEEII